MAPREKRVQERERNKTSGDGWFVCHVLQEAEASRPKPLRFYLHNVPESRALARSVVCAQDNETKNMPCHAVPRLEACWGCTYGASCSGD